LEHVVQKGLHFWFIWKACAFGSPTETAQGTDSGSGWFSWSTWRCSCWQLWLISPLRQVFLPAASGQPNGGGHAPQLLQFTHLTNLNWSWWQLTLTQQAALLSTYLCFGAEESRGTLLLRDSDISAPLLNPENLMSQSLRQQQL